jgi:hypothetical protein
MVFSYSMKPFASAPPCRARLFALILLLPLLFAFGGTGLSVPDLHAKRDNCVVLAKLTADSSTACPSKTDQFLYVSGFLVPEEPVFLPLRFPRQVSDSTSRGMAFATLARAPPIISVPC